MVAICGYRCHRYRYSSGSIIVTLFGERKIHVYTQCLASGAFFVVGLVARDLGLRLVHDFHNLSFDLLIELIKTIKYLN